MLLPLHKKSSFVKNQVKPIKDIFSKGDQIRLFFEFVHI